MKSLPNTNWRTVRPRLLEEQDEPKFPSDRPSLKNSEIFRNPKLLICFLGFPIIKPLELKTPALLCNPDSREVLSCNMKAEIFAS